MPQAYTKVGGLQGRSKHEVDPTRCLPLPGKGGEAKLRRTPTRRLEDCNDGSKHEVDPTRCLPLPGKGGGAKAARDPYTKVGGLQGRIRSTPHAVCLCQAKGVGLKLRGTPTRRLKDCKDGPKHEVDPTRCLPLPGKGGGAKAARGARPWMCWLR